MSKRDDVSQFTDVLADKIDLEERLERQLLRELRSVEATSAPALSIPVGTPLVVVERAMTLATLAYVKWNKTEAARLLGVSRRTTYNKLDRYAADGTCAGCTGRCVEGDLPWPHPSFCAACAERVGRCRRRRGNFKLSEAGARAVIRRAAAGEDLTALADEYNVRLKTVWAIVYGLTWKSLDRPWPPPARRPPGRRSKLSDEQVLEIRRRRAANEGRAALATEFQVTVRTVSKVTNRRTP